MKQIRKINTVAWTVLLICAICTNGFSQSDPVAYMSKISEAQNNATKEYLDYTSAVAHGKSARKVEKRRNEMISALNAAKARVKNMKPYNGEDVKYRDASYNYLSLCYTILKEDYGKIVDMEEIAEQSYDNMEAYVLMQDKADEKLYEEGLKLDSAEKEFARKYNVTLVDSKSELGAKAEKAGKVNNYYHNVYLVFFKSANQENYLVKALNEKNVNSLEQTKNALAQYAAAGLQKLDTMKGFMGDGSLKASCERVLKFYVTEANEKMQVMVDFFIKGEQVEKLKASSQKSKVDMDNYNKAVKEFNDAVAKYNKTNNELNTNRNRLLNDWNNTCAAFLDRHTPFSK